MDRLMAILASAAVIGGLLFAFAPESLWHSASIKPASKRAAAPSISLADINGQAWNLEQHRGNVVLVNFWATWCPPCRAETPGLVHVANELGPRGLDVVGISLDETKDVVPPFVSSYKIPYPIVMGEGSPITAGINSIPTTLLIDKQGRIAKRYEGAVSESTLERDITQLLAE